MLSVRWWFNLCLFLLEVVQSCVNLVNIEQDPETDCDWGKAGQSRLHRSSFTRVLPILADLGSALHLKSKVPHSLRQEWLWVFCFLCCVKVPCKEMTGYPTKIYSCFPNCFFFFFFFSPDKRHHLGYITPSVALWGTSGLWQLTLPQPVNHMLLQISLCMCNSSNNLTFLQSDLTPDGGFRFGDFSYFFFQKGVCD